MGRAKFTCPTLIPKKTDSSDGLSCLTFVFYLFYPVGQEIREKFSGAVEVFSRKHASTSGRHGDHSKNRTSEDVPSSKDVVMFIS